jgi:hypothetical protein
MEQMVVTVLLVLMGQTVHKDHRVILAAQDLSI